MTRFWRLSLEVTSVGTLKSQDDIQQGGIRNGSSGLNLVEFGDRLSESFGAASCDVDFGQLCN